MTEMVSEKPTPSQVGPLGAWSTEHVGRGARRLGGPRYEGRVDLGEQD